MFTQLTPILAGDDHQGVGADAVLARFEVLYLVMATLARITGRPGPASAPSLSSSAAMADAVSRLPKETARLVATECDSIALTLTAGLVALERARLSGRLNRSAAQLLHDECTIAMAAVRDCVMGHG